MTDRDRIPVVQVKSGEKFTNDRGITAIKDGIKQANAPADPATDPDDPDADAA